MGHTKAQIRHTTRQPEILDLMEETGLYENRKECERALMAVATAYRSWLIAVSKNPPKNIEQRATIPSVGTIRLDWTGYDTWPDHLRVRFTPAQTIKVIIKKHNQHSRAAHPRPQQEIKHGKQLKEIPGI